MSDGAGVYVPCDEEAVRLLLHHNPGVVNRINLLRDRSNVDATRRETDIKNGIAVGTKTNLAKNIKVIFGLITNLNLHIRKERRDLTKSNIHHCLDGVKLLVRGPVFMTVAVSAVVTRSAEHAHTLRKLDR